MHICVPPEHVVGTWACSWRGSSRWRVASAQLPLVSPAGTPLLPGSCDRPAHLTPTYLATYTCRRLLLRIYWLSYVHYSTVYRTPRGRRSYRSQTIQSENETKRPPKSLGTRWCRLRCPTVLEVFCSPRRQRRERRRTVGVSLWRDSLPGWPERTRRACWTTLVLWEWTLCPQEAGWWVIPGLLVTITAPNHY